MDRLRQVVGIAKAVRDAVGYVDFEGVADTAVADLHFAVKIGKQYDELAEALGCGSSAAPSTWPTSSGGPSSRRSRSRRGPCGTC